MPIPSTGEIKLNDDVNATLQADTNEQDVSLGDNNTVKFTAVGDGSTVSGRSMSELRGQTLFQVFPATADTGALGQSLHMDGLSSSHNSVKVLEPASTTAPVFTNTRGTFSFWIKIHETEASKRYLYTSGTADGSLVSILLHSSGTNHKLQVRINNLSNYITKAIFIDKAGWYNFVVSLDSNVPQDDIKVNCYANGIRLTWEQVANMSDGQAIQFGTNQRINDWAFAAGYGADATYANFVFVDGSALLPNEFGELKQGIWVPKGVNTPSSQSLVTTNLTGNYEFIGGSLQDTSGNGNHLTANGTSTGGTALQNNYGSWKTPGSNSSYLKIPDIINSHSTTINMWIHPVSLSTTENFFHATKEIYGIWNIANGNYNIYFAGVYLIQNRPAQKRWTMLTLTTTGPRDAQLYIDGNLVKTHTAGSDFAQNYNYHDNTLGYTHHTSTPNNGEMIFGEVQIYSSGLTAAQVLQNYNAAKYKYFYGLNGWHLNFNNTDQGSIVTGSKVHLDVGDWDADGTDETSFSGTAWNDKAGSHNFALTGSPTYSSNNGGYFDFDGSDDKATTSTTISNTFANNVTYEMWVNMDESNNYTLVYGKQSASVNGILIGNFGGAAGNIEVYRYLDGSSSSSSATITGTGLTTGKWQHLVFVMEDTCRVYVDGALTATGATFSATYPASFTELNIGAGYGASYRSNFKIAQFRVYSKALTAQEVVQNFRATQGHYEVLSLADISGNAKGGAANGTNLNGSDHTGDKPDVSYATLSSLAKSSYITLSNGGTALTHSQSSWRAGNGTIGVNSGKWYYEVKMTAANTSGTTANNAYFVAGWVDASAAGKYEISPFSTPYNRVIGVFDSGAFGVITNGTSPNYGTSNINSSSQFAVNDVLGIALDADTGSVQIYKNGSTLGSAVTLTADAYMVYYAKWSSTHGNGIFNFGAKGFAYTPPSGYKALSSDNLPTATGVDPVNQKKPRDYFESVTYNGTGIRNEIKSLDFQPDFIWIQNIKSTGGYHNAIIDSVRGVNSILSPTSTGAEQTSYIDQLESFDTNGFSLGNNSGSGNYVNLAGNEYIAWAWKASGAPTVDNAASAGAAPTLGSVMIDGVASTASLAGSLAAKKISANTNSGFSIVKYTSTGTSGATIAHGLGGTPDFVVFKCTSNSSTNWILTVTNVISNKHLYLNNTGLGGTGGFAVNSTTITLNNTYGDANTSGRDYIAYCWRSISGYSKIGTYSANNNANGPFVYTGFKPAYVLLKKYSGTNYSSSDHWWVFDNSRNPFATTLTTLAVNSTEEQNGIKGGGAIDSYDISFLSNGFKVDGGGEGINFNGDFIYMAFAEDPAKYAQGIGQTSDTEKFLEKGAGETQYPANHFQSIAYPGNGATHQIDLNFQPDLVWIKNRSAAHNHVLNDSMRGANKIIYPDITNAQDTAGGPGSAYFNSFNSNGFTVGSSVYYNGSGSNHVAWAWKAGDTQVIKKPTYTSAGILTSNLVLHYTFADSNTYAGTGTTVYDLTSNDNDGTLVNSPTWIDRANGNYFSFDGSNDQLTTSYTLPSGGAVTYEVWYNPNGNSGTQYILGQGVATASKGPTIYWHNLAFGALVAKGVSALAGSATSSTTHSNTSWHHVVFTWDGSTTSNAFKVYVNGILEVQGTSDASSSSIGASTNFAIAGLQGGTYAGGNIGQARIYTAELTQAQIRANYDATRTLYQGVGTTGNVLQTGLLSNIDVDSFDSYDSSKFGADNKVAVFPGGNATGTDNGTAINLPANIDDPMRTASAFAISVWYKHDTQNNTYGGKIVSLLNNIYNFINVNTNGTWYGRVSNSSNTSTEITGLAALSVGTWYHIVWTGNATNGCTLYCNGVKQGNGAWNGSFTTYSSPHYQHNKIGHQGIEVGYLKGSIDMVRFYNREVTSAEVKTLFHETSATTSTLNTLGDTSCYAAYNFNSDSGTHIDDLSTNYDAVSFGSLSFATDAEVTGWMVKDLTSNKLDLGGFYNATINKANSWGRSIKYDGTGDFVNLPVGLGRTATQDVTRELWVKIDDLPAGSNSDGLLYIGDMSANQYYENLRITSDGTIDYQERPTNSSGGSDFILSTNSYAGTLSVGVWYHVAYTSQGRIKKIYINGKLIASKTASSDRPNNSAYGGSLGSFRGSAVATTQGEIAQFRSYTSALTDAQIKANYDATKAQFYSALIHSSVSVNEKAGFSIAKHKGDGVLSSRIAHGLSSQPDFLVVKNIDTAGTSWATWLSVFSSPSETLFLDYAGRSTQYTNRFTNVSETTFQAGNAGSGTAASSEVNKDGSEMIVYAWKSVPGYSKIGRYKGTGSSGHSIEIGFQPSWVMIKNITSTSSTGWLILDAARDSINDNGNAIFASSHIAEWGASNTTINIDFTPTGFEIQNSYVVVNGSSDSYIYMAFA